MGDISRYKGGACKKMATGGAVRAAPLRQSRGRSRMQEDADASARASSIKEAGARAPRSTKRMAVGGQVQTPNVRPMGPQGPMPTPMAPPVAMRMPVGPQAPQQAFKEGGDIKPPRGPYIEFGEGGRPIKTTGEAIMARGTKGRKRG